MTNELDAKTLKQLLLEAPEGHLDQIAIDSIKEWDDEPKAIQILKTLDMCVHSGLSSGFVIGVLEQMLTYYSLVEKVSYEDLIKQADWRNNGKSDTQ